VNDKRRPLPVVCPDPDDYCFVLGATLHRARTSRNLIGKQVSSHISVSTDMLSRFERGRDKPSLPILSLLAGFYGLDFFPLLVDVAARSNPVRGVPTRVDHSHESWLRWALLVHACADSPRAAERRRSAVAGRSRHEPVRQREAPARR